MPTILTHDSVVQDFLKGIAGVRPRICRLILFGSRARGTHASDSDYDLLVVVSKKDPLLLDALYDTVMDVLLKHGRLVSLKIFEEPEFARLQALQTPFMKHVTEEGQPLG
jgi:predicted nucleotidyltransferase